MKEFSNESKNKKASYYKDMLPNIPREYVRLCSLLLFVLGAITITFVGWHDAYGRSIGTTFMAGSIWLILMSESILLSKVQNETKFCTSILERY